LSGAPPPSAPASRERIAALDGLRGIAACVVIAFHYLYLFYPGMIPPDISPTLARLADTPLGILWNGRFAVVVFFVLSGFVIAGAGDRRRESLLVTVAARYLRLAIPVLMSVLVAWVLLRIFPTATLDLIEAADNPSRWAAFTYQGEIPSFAYAVADGLLHNFVRGGSYFNNVLWTMQIELIGSVGIFVLYAMSKGPLRIALLIAVGAVLILDWRLPLAYLAFVLGALLYEAQIRGWLKKMPPALPILCLIGGLLLGAPGPGAAGRIGVDDLPILSNLGATQSLTEIIAAALIVFSVLSLRNLKSLLSHGVVRWLGRISFSLYLLHVPLLYTIAAFAYVHLEIPPIALAAIFTALTFALAHVFTIAVDEMTLKALGHFRRLAHARRGRKALQS
jgi:peptidoglycan/LPS O-acetylase OafA/YrhL